MVMDTKVSSMPGTSSTEPKTSRRRPADCGATCGKVLKPTNSEATPTGTLMRKIYSQGSALTIKPPNTGPHIIPRATKLASSPRARPRSRAGNDSVMMPMLFAMADAQPTPCTARASTKNSSVVAMPHKSEPSAKIATPTWKKRTLP